MPVDRIGSGYDPGRFSSAIEGYVIFVWKRSCASIGAQLLFVSVESLSEREW